jgi:hypothetical protein
LPVLIVLWSAIATTLRERRASGGRSGAGEVAYG